MPTPDPTHPTETVNQQLRKRRWWRYVLLLVGIGMGAIAGYFAATPSPINAQAWTPPQAPSTDLLSQLPAVPGTLRLGVIAQENSGGQEHVAVGADGVLYSGGRSGMIWRHTLNPDNPGQLQRSEEWATVMGRPLGMTQHTDGSLVVCATVIGLTHITDHDDVDIWTRQVGNEPFHFANACVVLPDGSVVFTNSTRRFDSLSPNAEQLLAAYDMLEAKPHGSLLRYDPATGTTEKLLDNLYFPNGVALVEQAEDGNTTVLVAETFRYRILKVTLRAGAEPTVAVFADNLPGFPDGIDVDAQGRVWVACPQPRSGWADWLHGHPWLKEQLTKLPASWWHRPAGYSLVLTLDADGNLIGLSKITASSAPLISSITCTPDGHWLGSLAHSIPDVKEVAATTSK